MSAEPPTTLPDRVRSLVTFRYLEKPAALCMPAAAAAFRESSISFQHALAFRTNYQTHTRVAPSTRARKCIGRNQAIVRKACHIVISAHGDRLWRTQEFFWTYFAIASQQELIDFAQETKRIIVQVEQAIFKITVGNVISRINNVTDCISVK
jgi:hypothetical protein